MIILAHILLDVTDTLRLCSTHFFKKLAFSVGSAVLRTTCSVGGEQGWQCSPTSKTAGKGLGLGKSWGPKLGLLHCVGSSLGMF